GEERLHLAHDGAVGGVAFSPDGQRIVTAALDNYARIFDSRFGNMLGPPLPHESKVAHAAFSPSGEYLLTASVDLTLRVWRLDVVNKPWSAPALVGSGRGNRLVWSQPPDVVVVRTSPGETVRRWTIPGGRLESFLLDADGRHLLACVQMPPPSETL